METAFPPWRTRLSRLTETPRFVIFTPFPGVSQVSSLSSLNQHLSCFRYQPDSSRIQLLRLPPREWCHHGAGDICQHPLIKQILEQAGTTDYPSAFWWDREYGVCSRWSQRLRARAPQRLHSRFPWGLFSPHLVLPLALRNPSRQVSHTCRVHP